MSQTGTFPYAEADNVKLLEFPYEGDDLSMLVILPDDVDGLRRLHEVLNAKRLDKWIRMLEKRQVRVVLPKFKITSQFGLKGTLTRMGMPDAFSGQRADFSGMDGNPGLLYIGAVIHKAFVEVNEEGTVAAAATAVIMRGMARPRPLPIFRADHPFVFL